MLVAVSLFHLAKDIVLSIEKKQIPKEIGATVGARITMANTEGSTIQSAGRKYRKNIETKIIGVNPVSNVDFIEKRM